MAAQTTSISTDSEPLDEVGSSYWSYVSPHAGAVIDTREDLETPEGAIIHVRPAGIAIRAGAFLVDEMIKTCINVAVLFLIRILMPGPLGTMITYLTIFLVMWFYGVLFEVFNDGRTPGKAMVNLKAVNADGTPIRLPAALIRNVFKVLEGLPLACVPAVASMAITKNFRRLGDVVANTIVIYDDKPSTAKISEVVVAKPLPASLTADEQVMLTEYQSRVVSFSRPRATELAEILQPLHGESGEPAVKATLGYAQGIRGGQ